MVFTNKSKSSGSSEGWGMGFLLVFFPEEDENHQESNTNNSKKKASNLNPFSPSFKRTNSSNLLYKAQSAISICLLLLFTTVMLFALSTLPSAATTPSAAHLFYRVPRRHLSSRPPRFSSNSPHALQGMGTLYRRGTRAMSELIIAHAAESLTQHELKLFLRLFHHSALASKSDLLLIFSTKTAALDKAILEETESFSNLLTRNASGEVTQLTKISKEEKESGEPIWGRSGEGEAESTRTSYGSVVGFEAEELDPEKSLSGFVEHDVPMSLRRWACYPMLLGRVRRNFKHVMLVDAKEFFIVGDPLGRVRNQRPESVLLLQIQSTHGKRNRKKWVQSGVLMGGSRGIRRLSNAMLTDIVRASTQHHHHQKKSVGESGLFNQLVGNDHLLKDVKFILFPDSLPDLTSISKPPSQSFFNNYTFIRRGNSNLDVVISHLCSFPIDSTLYTDCH